ncbi:DUF4040 domain-containing protein [Geminocystis sp. NIES-3709]|uniref:DUF4040 domain-containing protein n=1 Tax=Geminocystis sp. NIES-3709 TaxID=1617448 RepID=UPI00082540B9|nr:DUF4040 domain-containing protein [Geminocystis sp. NIES-3709]
MNNPDLFIYIITALLPLSAFLLVIQVNPYDALVIRGILGAIAALVYAVLGAGDVALTEALMGTLLAVALYIIAIRSSLVMRLGVLETDLLTLKTEEKDQLFLSLIDNFKSIIAKYYLRLELVSYEDLNNLEKALQEKEVHGICFQRNNENKLYLTQIRIKRLYEIFTRESSNINSNFTYINLLEK